MMKKCSKCKEEKGLEEFVKNSRSKSGYAPICKDCKKKHYYENKDKILEKQREYYEENKEVISKRNKDYFQRTKEERYKKQKEYNKNNPEVIKAANQRYRDKNKEEINRKNREYYNQPEVKEKRNVYFEEYRKREEVKERMKRYAVENKEKRRIYILNWTKEKYKTDLMFRLHHCFSAQMRASFKRYGRVDKGYRHSFDMVPYTKEQLKQHLESLFNENMNWENYGSYWQIDHIIPRSHFKFVDYKDEAFQKCWALENLRPLESIENAKKGNKILVK